jgi:hypothetical protein
MQLVNYLSPKQRDLDQTQLAYNGPAIWGGCVPAFCHKKRDGACFCLPIAIGTGTNFIEHYECRAEGHD